MSLKKRKLKLWAAFRKDQEDDVIRVRYNRCNNDLRRHTRNLRQKLERKLVTYIKANPKGFWRYAASRTKAKFGVEDFRTEVGELTTSDAEKAAVLNAFFNSVQMTTNAPPTKPRTPTVYQWWKTSASQRT